MTPRGYTALLRLSMPLVLLRLWWRGRKEPQYRSGVSERFGYYMQAPNEQDLVWLHAVSVGEARASVPLVRALRRALPDHRILVTCMTAAGRETLRQVLGEAVSVVWLPYDTPGAVRRFLGHFRPRLGIIMETEVWPNLLEGCEREGIPVLLANARMSEKSARGYRRWEGVTGAGFRRLAAVLAQSEADAGRLKALGARNVTVAGNVKFDVPPDDALVRAGREWRAKVGRPVLLLASTREGEERLLLDALPSAAQVLVVVVPRHPQRFDEVAPLCDSRRTAQPMPGPGDRVHLGDTMGEMAFYYAACDVAVIGGSFEPLGGQNLIEALSAGAPVVSGPHMFNFAEATRLACESGAAVQAADASSALRTAVDLANDPVRRQRMAQAGRDLVEKHRGATERHLEACLQLLTERGRG